MRIAAAYRRTTSRYGGDVNWDQLVQGVELPFHPDLKVPALTEVLLPVPQPEPVGDVQAAAHADVVARLAGGRCQRGRVLEAAEEVRLLEDDGGVVEVVFRPDLAELEARGRRRQAFRADDARAHAREVALGTDNAAADWLLATSFATIGRIAVIRSRRVAGLATRSWLLRGSRRHRRRASNDQALTR